jgi:Zn-dependent protease with chaperone function
MATGLLVVGGLAVSMAQEPTITEYRLPPDALARSEALYRTTIAITIAGTVYGVALLAGLLWGRVAPRYRDLAERASGRRFVQALVFVPLLLLTIDVLSLPVSVYGHSLQVRYGLSVQGWGSWFWDWTKGELLGTALGTLLVWGLYAFLRRSPRRWWFYGWLAAIPVVLLLVLIGPIVVAPMFDTFAPLEERQPVLVPELEKVLARGGVAIERSRMFEMQASDKVTTYNAYVTGIGASKRVVVWDNTSRDLAVPETLFVFGHEMGHYVLHHVWWTLGLALTALLAQLYLAYRLLGGLLARYGPRWGIRDAADWASLPVILLLLTGFGLIAQPGSAAVSRYLEHQADIYGLEAIHGLVPDSSQAAAHAFQKLGEKALTYPTPHPLFVFWAFSHPPMNERVRFAATYRPWDRGEPGRYIR